MKKILIMSLPDSGKTTLASKLVPLLDAKWINNDKVRKSMRKKGELKIKNFKKLSTTSNF